MPSLNKSAMRLNRLPLSLCPRKFFEGRASLPCNNRASSSTVTTVTTERENQVRITIPTRIERSPTDVLKALASTLERDFTAAHYKYHDDPYLTPLSNISKRSYALSKESGRRAARYFLENYPHLFYRDDAEPKIPAFSYPDTFSTETQVNENDLKNCIGCRQVANAIQVYENCKKLKVEISQQVLQSFLELVCFYNNQEGPDAEYLEQTWFRQRDDRVDRKKTWLDGSLAEKIFESMPDKTPEAMNALISGFGRFNAAEKALKMYEEARGNNVLLEADTYNSLLKVVPFLRGSGDSQWELILDLLRDMSVTNTRPNLGTLNEILDVLTRLGIWKNARNMALRTVSEMKKLGVEPSLGSYSCLLTIFINDRTGGANPQILYDIMDIVEGKDHSIRHPKDVTFFVNAMSVAREPLGDLELASRIHQLLLKGENYKLIGDGVKESVYFAQMVKLICQTETMDGIRDFYMKYVPHVYTPEPGVMAHIIEAAEFHEAYDFLPLLWSDCQYFEYSTRDQVYKPLLKAMANAKTKDSSIHEKLVTVTQDFIKKIDEAVSEERYGSGSKAWSGEMLSTCMRIFLNGNDLEKANQVLIKLAEKQNDIMGFADTDVLQDYCQKLIESNEIESLLRCCKYATDVGNDFVIKFVGENLDKIPEDDLHRKKLVMMVQSVS